MQEITGKHNQDFSFDYSVVIKGQANGNVAVVDGGILIIRGQLNGNLTIHEESEVVIHGQINGDVINNGGNLEVFGMINGRLFRERGNTFIDENAFIKEM